MKLENLQRGIGEMLKPNPNYACPYGHVEWGLYGIPTLGCIRNRNHYLVFYDGYIFEGEDLEDEVESNQKDKHLSQLDLQEIVHWCLYEMYVFCWDVDTYEIEDAFGGKCIRCESVKQK